MKILLILGLTFGALTFNAIAYAELKAEKPAIRHPPEFHKPFWKSKPEVQKQIIENDLIVVSADTDKIQEKPPLYLMKVRAGGLVKAPFDFTFDIITDYEKLKNVDDHFKESKYDKEKKILFLHLEALGYHARMHLKLNEVEVTGTKNKVKQVHWECIQGQFLGMKGVFQIEEIERQKTEISMTAEHRSETLLLPKILMGLGLEIVGRQVAVKMREYIVDQYKK